MPPLKNKTLFPLYSIKEAIEDFCTVLFESVKFGNITDEKLASKYNVGPKTKNYTYKRRSCVEYGLITRESTNNSLSQTGIQILRSQYYKKSRVEVTKILSFIHSVGMKALLRNFINNNESIIYDNEEFYVYLLEEGVTESNIKRIIKAFNESLEYLEIITPERKIDLNDEYIKLIKSNESLNDKDNINSIITNILIKTNKKDGINDRMTEMIKDQKNKDTPDLIENTRKLDSLTDIPFTTMSGKSGSIKLREDSSGELEYVILRKDLTDKEKKMLNDLVVSIYNNKN